MKIVRWLVGTIVAVAGLLTVIWISRKLPVVGPMVDTALTK